MQSLRPGEFPSVTTRSGNWVTTGRGYWTSGFFPGTLWLLYQHTTQRAWLRAASTWTSPLAPQARVTRSHDVGFEILSSFGNGFAEASPPGYRAVLLRAAASLASRYNATVGAIRSWGPRNDARHFEVIVDGLMNAELLFWGAAHGGPARWAQIATRHDLTTLRHLVRPDGSVVHMVDFDPSSGAVLRLANPQGYDLSSTWSRGQAWAIAGFTIAYRATGDPRFLDAARATAGYFVAHLPADCVPYWDFDAPGIPHAPRDSSAAAVAADYLLELGALEPARARAAADVRAAARILGSLETNFLAARGAAVLDRGTADEALGRFDIGTSYGDYYFVSALDRFLRLRARHRDVLNVTPSGGRSAG
jgi:unsaturated chondroitin disaccharide hydrolase